MNLSAVIFVSVLFVIGICCILLVRSSIKRDAEEQVESDKALAAQSARLLALTPQQALARERAAARKEAAQKRADRWKNLTPSLVNQAFVSFYKDDAEPKFDSSTVSAAFEKFTEETRVKH